MKVLVVSNLYPPDVIGGYELGCRQVVDALRARGHEVHVLTSAPRQPVEPVPHVRRKLVLTDIWSPYLFHYAAPITVHLDQSASHRINAKNVHVLLEELEDFQPDVVYLWLLVGVGGLGLLGCLQHLKVPWVWHLMDDVPLMLCRLGPHLIPAFVREFNRQIRGHYLACSQQLVDEIEASGIHLNGEIEVLPNWVQGPIPEPRAEYLEGGWLRIVSAAGQIDRRINKGIDLLIEAAARLRKQGHEQFVVDLYGHVADPYFESLIHEHHLENQVFLKGRRSQTELAALYPHYDVFAFPTHAREPFGFAPLEAAAHGCVPILAHTCGIAEWLVHGVHCLKAPRTAEAFAAHFAAILDGSVDLSAIGHRAAAVIQRDFHLEALIVRIERALARAARQPRAGAGTPAEAYRMALLAERLARVLLHEAICA
ncbi:MAG: glycosyltransferase family 4 protein [Isosphaeraceae bacterium]|nr:glycosyltransferase family 4 protein [Isosphaeraceae bacterium]